MDLIDIIIIGGGPMGIATAIEAKKNGYTCKIIEKGVLVNSLYHFPDQMTFFSTSRRLEIGGIPFMSTKEKPTRDEALEYYRRVVEHWELDIHTHENVLSVDKTDDGFLTTTKNGKYLSKYIVISTGFYSINNRLNVPGEDLPKVSHYYKDPHPYFRKKVAIVGAANSAAQIALDLFHKGIDTTIIVRQSELSPRIKYWIRPNIINRIKENSIKAYFESNVVEIKENSIIIKQGEDNIEIENDFVLAMIGYRPDYDLLRKFGVTNCDDIYDTPNYDEQQQTNIQNMYIAGVVCGGLKTSRFMIEDSIIHAEQILADINKKEKEPILTK